MRRNGEEKMEWRILNGVEEGRRSSWHAMEKKMVKVKE